MASSWSGFVRTLEEGCKPSPCEMERQIPCGVRSRAGAKRSAVRRRRRSNLSWSKSENTSANKKQGIWGTVASALVNQGVLQSDDRSNWVTAFEAAQSSSHPLCGTDSNVWSASKCNRRRHCLPVKETKSWNAIAESQKSRLARRPPATCVRPNSARR
jgi:hypothetical protein